MFPTSSQNDDRSILSNENNFIIGSAPIQIPNSNNNNNNNITNNTNSISINTNTNNTNDNNNISNTQPNHVAIGYEHSFSSDHKINNKLEANIPIGSYPVMSSSSSYTLRNGNNPIITKSMTINSSERTFEKSVSSSFKSPLHTTFIPNSFDSATIDNNSFVDPVININNANQLFSGSLPVGSLNSNHTTNNNNIDNVINSYQEDDEDIPHSNTKFIEEVNTNTTTTPTQYYKDHQGFHENNITYNNSDPQVNLDYVVNNTTTTQNENVTKIEGILESKPLLNIAKFPTEDLLKMLTALLEKIVNSNDEINATNLNHSSNLMENDEDNEDENETTQFSVSCFYGKHVPQISIEQYLLRIQKYCPTTNDIFLSLLVYFDRISKKCNNNNTSNTNSEKQNFVMDSYNIHRLLISAVAVSTKFFSDFFYSNARYARVGGIPLHEMNKLEIQFMILCDFKLLIPVDELQRYADLLYTFWTTNHGDTQDQSQHVQFNNDPNDTQPSFTSEGMTST